MKYHRHLPVRIIGSRPRLFACIGLGVIAYFLLPNARHLAPRLLLAWNLSMIVYLILVGWMILRATPQSIRRRAAAQDEGRFFILILSIAAAAASIGAIVAQLAVVKETSGGWKALHIGLAASTIFTAWLFIHLMFALHYAHEFFFEQRSHPDSPGELRGGLQFPDDERPDYSDFLYFSFAIGCASATSDVNVTSKPMRRIVLAQSALSFFFNTTVVALTINIAAGLIS
jgi:uncharacterized membrane protein